MSARAAVAAASVLLVIALSPALGDLEREAGATTDLATAIPDGQQLAAARDQDRARPAAAWPGEGSYAIYTLEWQSAAPDGSFSAHTTANLTLVFAAGEWRGICKGETQQFSGGAYQNSTWIYEGTMSPAVGPTHLGPGTVFNQQFVEGGAEGRDCRQGEQMLVVQGQEQYVTRLTDAEGQPVTTMVWLGVEPSDSSPYSDVHAAWDAHTGLFLDWEVRGHGGIYEGHVKRSDAPVA